MKALRRPLVLVGLAVVVVGLIATIVAVQHSKGSTANAKRSATVPSSSVPSARSPDAASPEGRINTLQQQLDRAPDDWESLALLGSAFVAEAARTGDPSLYPRAEESIGRSLEVRPEDNLAASIAQSSLSAARHDFARALDWADKALELSPQNTTALGAKGDALVELGRYDEAFATFQEMVNLRPGVPSYSRISYARELQGDAEGAVTAMTAAESAAGSTTDAAFAAYQLGELEWNRGNVKAAVGHYRRAVGLDPGAVRAEAALARAAYFDGDANAAIDQYRTVTDRLPLPQYIGELTDVYAATDQPKKVKQQLGLLDVQRRLFEANGVSVDADLAVINADNKLNLKASLKAMRAEWKIRKSVVVADALAWVLHANGRDEEALTYSEEAMRLGTRNALFFYHRSEIYRGLGQTGLARLALAQAKVINPNFSIRYAEQS